MRKRISTIARVRERNTLHGLSIMNGTHYMSELIVSLTMILIVG
jgi:hypothetical protein